MGSTGHMLRSGRVRPGAPAGQGRGPGSSAWRLSVLEVPALRGLAMLLVTVFLFLHNRLYLHQDAWRETLTFLGVSLTYTGLSFLILRKGYARWPRAHLATVFLVFDLILVSWVLVLSGGEKSWLFWLPIARVVDQAMTTFRRALVSANLVPFSFILAVAYVRVWEGRPVDGGEALAKVLVLYGWCLYVALTARAAERLRRGKREAEEANRAKSAFLACVSHELRTPLNAILLYTELLKQGVLATGQQELLSDLEHTRDSASHLLEIVTDMLEMAQLEVGQARLTLSDFDLSGLVDELVRELHPLAESQGNVQVTDLPPRPLKVHLDAPKVRQILKNLLSNAHRFTEGGTVRLELRWGEAMLVLKVQDSGMGIPTESQAAIFEPFTQAEEYFTRRHDGAGLGLAISLGYARMMGGELRFESEEGKGTTFILELPVALENPLATAV